MSCYYLDASALVKRYVNEVGSQWILNIAATAEGLAVDNPNEH
jgi:predicted nucleic acid-binding protein